MSATPSGQGWAPPGSAAEPRGPGDDGTAPSPDGTRRGDGRGGGAGPARSGRHRDVGWDDGIGGLVSSGAAEAPVPRLELRPMTAADIIDGAFEVVRARALRIFGFTAALATPVYLMLAFWQRDATGAVGIWDVFAGMDDPGAQQEIEQETAGLEEFLQLTAAAVLSGLVLAAVAVAVAYQMGSWVAGRDAPAGELAAAVGRRAWPLVASWVVVHVAELAALLLCVVPVLFIMPFFVCVAPAIGAEQAGPLTAVTRSWRLVAARYWPALGITLLTGLVAALLSLVLTSWVALPSGIWGWDVAWPLVGLANILATVITTPFVAAAAVLLYLDLRVRNEGLDLELAARETFGGSRR